MSKNKSGYTGLKTSERTSNYFDSAALHFQNVNKAAADCKTHASTAIKHAINVLENGAKTICSVQELVSDANSSNYSVVATFAQATVAGLATAAYYNPPALIGAFTLGAILISPSDSIECAKNTVKAGLIASHLAYETIIGLAEGTAGIVSLISDNIYDYDTPKLAGNNMIEYYV